MQIVNLTKKSNDNTDKYSVQYSVIDDDLILLFQMMVHEGTGLI